MYFAERGRRRPNVVLIQTDQWRSDCLSVAGHPVVKTPFLDGLACAGTRFTRAYTPSPTCVPSRMAMLTSLAPARNRRVGYVDGVDFDQGTTLAGAFGEAGYHTKAIGKMHVYPERTRAGFDDVVLHDGYCHDARLRARAVEFTDDWVPWLRRQPGQGPTADFIDVGEDPNTVTARPWKGDEMHHPSSFVVTQAIDWLYRRDPAQPFFLYLSFAGPHPPYTPPAWAFEQYLHNQANRDYVAPRGDWTDMWEQLRADHLADAYVADYDAETQLRARAGYFGNISHIDAQIARFYAALREFGQAYDTYVAFTSDHGELLGDHGMWRKGFGYEGSAGVPLLVAGPGLPQGTVCDDLVTLEDLMPTLLELAGADVPAGLDGRSHAPGLLGHRETADGGPHDHLHGEHVIVGLSLQWIITPRYIYLWRSSDGREQLFDMELDPRQERDLAQSAAHDAELARCRRLLVAHLDGRPEGFVQAGRLVAGREVSALLAQPFVPDDAAIRAAVAVR